MLLRDLTISDEAVGCDAPLRPCLEPLHEVCQDFRASGKGLEASLLAAVASGGMAAQVDLFLDRRSASAECQ
eukprot:1052091-Pyramimonas_sp.AAC.1